MTRALPTGAARLALFLVGIGYCAGFRLALWTMPTHRLIGLVNRRVPPAAAPPRSGAPPAEHLAWAVRAAGRRVPRGTCLVQALAAQLLLARNGYPSQLKVGVARGPDGEFTAHAWVEMEGRVVVGGARGKRFYVMPDLAHTLR